MRRRSPGVVGFRKSFEGRVFETSLMFHDASPASNQPALRPTRGSGFGFVPETIMLRPALGVTSFDDIELDDDDAHPAAAARRPRVLRERTFLMRGELREDCRLVAGSSCW